MTKLKNILRNKMIMKPKIKGINLNNHELELLKRKIYEVSPLLIIQKKYTFKLF